MKGIVKMQQNGNPSIVLPGVRMELRGPIADKFWNLPQAFADNIDVNAYIPYSDSSGMSFDMKLEIEGRSRDFAEAEEKAPEAATPGAGLKGSDKPTGTVTPDAGKVKGKEVR